MRIYVESYGAELPAVNIQSGLTAMEVLARLPGIYFRQPNRWERAVESIVDTPSGRVVSPLLRSSRAPICEPEYW